MKMKYKKIKRIAYLGNSDRCLILRQDYAKVMLDVLESGKTVLNIDETWINEGDFRPKKWTKRGLSNSFSSREVNPRISMISAVGTDGSIYTTLTQINTTE